MSTFVRIALSTLLIASLAGTPLYASTGDESPTFVGLPKKRTAEILDTFKAQEREILFETQPFTADEEDALFKSDTTLTSLIERLERTQDAKATYTERKKTATRQKITLKRTIEILDEDIAKTASEVERMMNEIGAKNLSIRALTLQIRQTQAKIDTNRQAILDYLVYIYTRGGSVYDSTADIDLVKTLILNEGDLGDIFQDLHSRTLLEQAGQNFIEIHRGLVKQFYYQQSTLREQKRTLTDLKNTLQIQQKSLEAQRATKAELLEITQGQEAKFAEYIAARSASEARIQKRIEHISDQYQAILQGVKDRTGCALGTPPPAQIVEAADIQEYKLMCETVDAVYFAEKSLHEYVITHTPEYSDMLPWPVSSSGLSTYFLDEEYYDVLGSSHEGIDIPVAQGTDIYSPMVGYVLYVNPPIPGGYSYLAIKHPAGFVTVYGHLSEVLVKPYEMIQPGQLIARSGGAYGTPGAGIMTSGPHLHYELWKNRESVDPLRYMDITNIDYETLPKKYQYKYIEDLKQKYGKLANLSKYDTFRIIGESEIERQKYLLSTYAAPDFRNWDVWVEESQEAGIDPSFVMCIGLAESTLGNYLKTPFNVGNVWNTDSGATTTFPNARSGIYWMAKTLNNQYLWQYQSIDQLSRWGNKDFSKPIYASSNRNWHNNIVRCLSALKGRFVEDDYEFRLSRQ